MAQAVARCRGRSEDSAPLYASSSPAVPRQSTKRIRCATYPHAIVHPYMQALPRRSPAKVLSGLGVHHIPRFHDLIHEYGARALRTSLAKAMHAWPWLEEVAAQRDTTGGVDAQTYCVCQSVTSCHYHQMLLSPRKCRMPKKMHGSYMPRPYQCTLCMKPPARKATSGPWEGSR